MKKIVLLLMLLSVGFSYGQKKKSVAKKAVASGSLAKNGTASVLFNTKNDLVLIVAKDTMLLSKSRTDFNPMNVKIAPVKVKANTFYCVTWNENIKTDTKLKKEVISVTENQIWNPTTKTLLAGNTQKAIDITEIVFLDRLKTASETQYKKRNEGYLFSLLPNGDFALSNKSTTTKYSYNEKTLKYEPKK